MGWQTWLWNAQLIGIALMAKVTLPGLEKRGLLDGWEAEYTNSSLSVTETPSSQWLSHSTLMVYPSLLCWSSFGTLPLRLELRALSLPNKTQVAQDSSWKQEFDFSKLSLWGSSGVPYSLLSSLFSCHKHGHFPYRETATHRTTILCPVIMLWGKISFFTWYQDIHKFWSQDF
jgi:hypothetical protein